MVTPPNKPTRAVDAGAMEVMKTTIGRLNAKLYAGNGRQAVEYLNHGRGRTGFDLKDALEAACRGWFVGLVKNRTKNKC